MAKFTAFCQKDTGTGTIWIEAIEADDLGLAIEVARTQCAEAWGMEPLEIHVLGIAEGDVKILHWEDELR